MANILTTLLDVIKAVTASGSTGDSIVVSGTVSTTAPAGGATSANQVIEIANLTSIDGKLQSQPAIEITSNISSSATVVTLLAANNARKAAAVYNDSTSVLYLKLGSSASSVSKKITMAAGSYYELPAPAYTGIITGTWATVNGHADVTES